MVAGKMKKGQGGRGMPEGAKGGGFKVVAATLFGGIEVARYPTLEQAEWRGGGGGPAAGRGPRGRGAARRFGGMEAPRYPPLEQAEWRAKQLAAEAERSPRGYVQYLVKPVETPR